MSWCHLCNRVTDEEFYLDHLTIYHPTTLFVMQAVALTPYRMAYINTFPFYLNDNVLQDYTDDGEYESLLSLCNEIGDHKIGIENITNVASIVDRRSISMHDTCPICLEDFIETDDDIYKLNVCNHSYCKECITMWCLENKTCPVCKTELCCDNKK